MRIKPNFFAILICFSAGFLPQLSLADINGSWLGRVEYQSNSTGQLVFPKCKIKIKKTPKKLSMTYDSISCGANTITELDEFDIGITGILRANGYPMGHLTLTGYMIDAIWLVHIKQKVSVSKKDTLTLTETYRDLTSPDRRSLKGVFRRN